MTYFKKLAFCAVFLGFLLGFVPAKADNFSLLSTGGVGGWVNVTRPLTEADMKGRLILLDFWTYGCVNCMQIVPDLKFLEQKYGDDLLIIGVHSAKFRGEQGSERILSAAKRFGLEHPVINDADYGIWKNFGVEAWPTQILLGANGQEISRYEGEGHRAELDKDIAPLIKGLARPKDRASVVSLVPHKNTGHILSFPARIKQYGDTLYIADSAHNRIIGTDKNGKINLVIGSGMQGLQDGDLKTAQFNNPRGMAVVGKRVYIADTGNHALRLADLETGKVTTLAGNGQRGSQTRIDDEKAEDVSLASPWDIAELPSGKLVIAMAGLHQLWAYDPVHKMMSVWAGTGREGIDDADREIASLAQPSGVSVTEAGDIYFVDAESSALRMIEDGKVKTLIGTGLFDFGLKDGTFPSAQMQHAQGLAATGDKIYIADTYNNALRVYDVNQKKLSTITTVGEKLNEPGSVWRSDANTLLITDTNNNRILKLDLKTSILSEVVIAK